MGKHDAPSEEKVNDQPKTEERSILGELFTKLGKEISEHKEKFTVMDEIEFPAEISSIEGHVGRPEAGGISSAKVGALVRIRPCSETLKDQTFLGIYIGDLPVDIIYEIEKENNKLHIRTYGNCAFFVFELNRIIFGCESWWSELKDDADIDRMITDADINNTPYVQALKALVKSEGEEDVDNKDS